MKTTQRLVIATAVTLMSVGLTACATQEQRGPGPAMGRADMPMKGPMPMMDGAKAMTSGTAMKDCPMQQATARHDHGVERGLGPAPAKAGEMRCPAAAMPAPAEQSKP